MARLPLLQVQDYRCRITGAGSGIGRGVSEPSDDLVQEIMRIMESGSELREKMQTMLDDR